MKHPVRVLKLAAAVVLAAFIATGCKDSPTAPRAPASIGGMWAGSCGRVLFDENGFPLPEGCDSSANIVFSQDGVAVTGTFSCSGCQFEGTLQGTIAGDELTGRSYPYLLKGIVRGNDLDVEMFLPTTNPADRPLVLLKMQLHR
jgi:hypothetical protein